MFRLALLLAVVAVVAAAGGYLYLRRSLPQTGGTVGVDGLLAPVTITRDRDAIPHIVAASREDAMFGLGYVHAQDRLWQMEFQRRIGAGRLSELLGEATLDTDRFLRTLGVYRAAQADYAALGSESRAAVDAYVAGVNAFLEARPPLAPEFLILGATPEPWSGADVVVWQKMMAWDLGENWDSELLRTDMLRTVGAERTQALMPATGETGPAIISAAALPAGDYGALLDLGAELRALLGAAGYSGDGLGSNNWVVDGSKSSTGKPLLADDPHLGTRLPAIWYLAHLRAGSSDDVIGGTLPGLPGVVIGRNRNIAWGVTNVGPDVQDLFRERLDASGTLAEYRGRMEPLQIITETIRVKGAEDEAHRIRISRHGPLISDAINANRADAPPDERQPAVEPLAFRWSALDTPDTTMDAFLGIGRARNWQEFTAALSRYTVPAQNFVYADVEGNIGYYAPGRYPIRAAGDGSLPAEGWSGANEWIDWVPFEALPNALNPPQGWIATANNRPAAQDYPYFLGREWALPYRYRRIAELLASKQQLSPDDMAAIQADTRSLHAAELLPRLLELAVPRDERQARAVELLRGWDFDARGESAAAAIFEAWYRRLPGALAEDELGTALLERYVDSFGPARSFVDTALAEENGSWCDDTGTTLRENCAHTAGQALDDALDELEATMGRNIERWRWDSVHHTVFGHQPFDSVPALRRLFSRSLPGSGDHSTVNVGPYSFATPFEQRAGPGYRHIIDLAELDGGRFIVAGGQSGHVLSPHYDDYLADWRAVRYRQMRMSSDAIEAAAASRLELRPINER